MAVAFLAFAGLAAFWVLIIALVKFERGWVGMSPARLSAIRLSVAMTDMARTVGEALIPAFRALGNAFVQTGEKLAHLLEYVQGDIE